MDLGEEKYTSTSVSEGVGSGVKERNLERAVRKGDRKWRTKMAVWEGFQVG